MNVCRAWEEQMNRGIELGVAQGIERGREQGRTEVLRGLYGMVQKGRISVAEAAEKLGIPISEVEKDMLRMGMKVPETGNK